MKAFCCVLPLDRDAGPGNDQEQLSNGVNEFFDALELKGGTVCQRNGKPEPMRVTC